MPQEEHHPVRRGRLNDEPAQEPLYAEVHDELTSTSTSATATAPPLTIGPTAET